MCIRKLFVNTFFVTKSMFSFLFYPREKEIARILTDNSLKLSTAESCTGGLVSSRLTDISGSSSYIYQNFVTYANEAKMDLLGVSSDSIEKYGVVSEQVACEMAQGLLLKYQIDIAVATTGIAGPLGATDNKPVGLVCIAVADKNNKKVISYKANSMLLRPIMKYAFTFKTLNLLLEFLRENYKS